MSRSVDTYSRRSFLRTAAMGSGLLIGASSRQRGAASVPSRRRAATGPFEPDVECVLRAVPDEAALLPGPKTPVLTLQGELLKGEPHNLRRLNDSYLGPTIDVRRGQRLRIHFENHLDEPSILHWHGLHVPEAADGHPRYAIEPGETYVYEFEVDNRAGTYWYHPHPHGRTGHQVYHGLSGLFLIHDDEEDAVDLPRGEFDVPLVIQDRTFEPDNTLIYTGRPEERILINGRTDDVLSVERRPYRLRVLNLSTDRAMKVAWNDGSPLTVIARDGGLLEQPAQVPYLMLGAAMRCDVWADFSDMELGTKLEMRSQPFLTGVPATMIGNRLWRFNLDELRAARDRFRAGETLPQYDGFRLFGISVDREASEKNLPVLPERMCHIEPILPETAVNRDHPKRYHFSIDQDETGKFRFWINRREFEMEAVAEDEICRLDTTEIWEFTSAGLHPIHVHGVQFQVLSRVYEDDGDDLRLENWLLRRKGNIDEGWQDTVLVGSGERVQVIMRFEDHEGLFLYHCHNLPHEDEGMMRNYRVVGPETAGYELAPSGMDHAGEH